MKFFCRCVRNFQQLNYSLLETPHPPQSLGQKVASFAETPQETPHEPQFREQLTMSRRDGIHAVLGQIRFSRVSSPAIGFSITEPDKSLWHLETSCSVGRHLVKN